MEETHEQFIKRLEKEKENKIKDLKQNSLFSVVNMRVSGEDKLFILNKFKEFAEVLTQNTGFVKVDFGKQDIRGGYSITPFYKDHTTGHQKHFKTKDELIGFVEGFLMGYEQNFNF